MGEALDWLDIARECMSDPFNTLTRGLLTSVFAPIIGLERIWHLDEMEDLGFALLTGGLRPPSRYRVGGWRRHLAWYEVDAFCRRTSPWYLLEDADATAVDAQVPHQQRLRHHPQQVHALREALLHLRCLE
jgi:hypothetical protein